MPRLPQRSSLFSALRPVGAAVAGAGLVLAILGSSSQAAAPVVSAHVSANGGTRLLSAPASRPASAPTPAKIAAPHVSRSYQRPQWVRPVAGPVTSGYGRRWGGFHPGIDIGAAYGAPVHAITGGWIASAGWIPGYGKVVRVYAYGLVFYYPHLSRILHRHGYVHTGEVIGRVGSTGFSTGPHLHVEIRHHGRPFNPRLLLWRHGVRL